MHNIEKPQIDDLEQYLKNCTDRLRKTRDEVRNLIPGIINECSLYEQNALNNSLYLLEKIALSRAIKDNKSFKKLYDNQMSSKTGCANEIYNKILASDPNDKCPYCSQGNVEELDHFLPKTDNGYPELSIIPINLVPSCHRCNHKKHEFIPVDNNKQFIHPYFINNINEYRWLYCNINYDIEDKPTFIFYVNCPEEMEDSIKECIKFQFEKLELAIFYSKNAASEYASIKSIIENHRGDRDFLFQMYDERAISSENYIKNSWQTAMYHALAEEIR